MSPSEYGTHIGPLVTAVMNTTGPVFEMGCGDFSTPLLHAICKVQGRELLSAETDKEWLREFEDLECDFHKMVYVPVYHEPDKINDRAWDKVGNQNWSVILIDHRPGERRAVDLMRFRLMAECLVVHDTEHPGYKYEDVFRCYKYRYDERRYNVWTTIVSNKHDVAQWFKRKPASSGPSKETD